MPRDWSTSSAAGVDLHLDLLPGEGRRDGLERALREAIRSGRLAAGSRLPATRALAEELGLARGTVSAAYDQLVAEGYLLARHGSGTTVAHVPHAAAHHPRRPAPKPRHDLRPGTGDVSSFPVDLWLRSTRRALAAAPSAAFGYAEDLRGRPELRAALADYLGRARGVAAGPDRIVVTAGYVHALTLLARALGPAGFALEDPGLPYHRELVAHAGNKLVPLPVDARGADPAALPAGVRALVTTPAHQYPTGVTLHPTRRRALIEWARSTGGVVIEDDYDGEFRYDRQPVGALQALAPGHVVYAGTSSKALAPGLRLAWLVLPPDLVGPVLEELRLSTLGTDTLSQLALADLIGTHGYDRHIRGVRVRYRRRRDALVAALAEFPRLSAAGISAGQHILVTLPSDAPDDPDEAELVELARRRDLAISGLAEHWHGAAAAQVRAEQPPAERMRGLVVGYGAPTDAGYRRALSVFVDVLREAYGG
ncbi:MAG TPA: PLP-dependent aminotransferase family protein [Actinospica sp.]|nr:PLP-dependent aminotransferase family protein [Actinospica sp.]